MKLTASQEHNLNALYAAGDCPFLGGCSPNCPRLQGGES